MARRSNAVERLLGRRVRAPRGTQPGETAALEAIWQVVCAIPRGRVATYGSVARAAGLPRRARLAGFALRVAPRELSLPWHRVIGAGGRIVFPSGSPQHREQARRLRAEGVAISGGKVASSALFMPDEA
jgi:methylated-DNA-protein-cysteine methyltransferase-like protein